MHLQVEYNSAAESNISSFMTQHRVCNQSNSTGVTSETGTAYPSGAPELTPVLVLPDPQLYVLCIVDRCLSFFFWSLSCLSIIDLRILITSFVSSNFSYTAQNMWYVHHTIIYENCRLTNSSNKCRSFILHLF